MIALIMQSGSVGNRTRQGSVRPGAGKHGWLSWGMTSGLLVKVPGRAVGIGAVAWTSRCFGVNSSK